MSQQPPAFPILLTLFAHDRAILARLQAAHSFTTFQEALSFALCRLEQLEVEKEFLQETAANITRSLEQERMELASTEQELTEAMLEMQRLNAELSHLLLSYKTHGKANADAVLPTQAYKWIQDHQLRGEGDLRRATSERYRQCLRRVKESQQASAALLKKCTESATLLKQSAELLRPQPPTDTSKGERN